MLNILIIFLEPINPFSKRQKDKKEKKKKWQRESWAEKTEKKEERRKKEEEEERTKEGEQRKKKPKKVIRPKCTFRPKRTETHRNSRNTPKFYSRWNEGVSHSGRNGTEYTTMVLIPNVVPST